AVIEHAFAEAGRPSGYILGKEGGGAFLGGLRYGEGTLYLRQGGTQKIYWHGPTLGFDVGAAGARTMFLIYKLREPDDLYRT
ncbi:EipA family protein, partial [Acinetobacter baumannii]